VNIDLFTLVAQIVNFLILLVALKLLLYGRIVRVMDEKTATSPFARTRSCSAGLTCGQADAS